MSLPLRTRDHRAPRGRAEVIPLEKLRELTGWEPSDEQAEEAVVSIRKFARVPFEVAKRQKQLTECNGKSDL
jgi:uncharacterized protein YqhQ